MQEPRPIVSHAIHSSQALFRFVLRLVLLCAFASLSTRGFGTALASLLAPVGDFLRGRRFNPPRAGVWSRADALGRSGGLRRHGPFGACFEPNLVSVAAPECMARRLP